MTTTAMRRKAFQAQVKALDGDDQVGRVEALVSVFGNVDSDNERVVKGAFTKSLERWKASGDPIPVIVQHDWADPWKHVGYADPNDVVETDVGLKAIYTLDVEDNPLAAQTYRLMKRRTLKQHSFGFDVKAHKRGEGGAVDLTELDLIEIGPALKGVNSLTDTLAVKADAAEPDADDTNEPDEPLTDSDRAKVKAALDTLQQILSPDEDDNEQENGKADEADDVKGEQPEGGSASDPVLLSLTRRINALKG